MFDDCDSTNTKDMTHQRRSKGNADTTVRLAADTPVTMKKEQFLANRQKKQRFIFMLSEELKMNNCEVHLASGDAELLIVIKAAQSSANCSNTVLVGDDKYLLVLLCYHASIASHDLFFCPEPKNNTKQPRIWYIKLTKQCLGPDICQHILFLHAVLGCDTTSRLHGIGKGASLKKIQASNSFRQQTKVLHIHSVSRHDVTCAGEKALVELYNGNSTDSLEFGISGSVRRSHRARLMFIHERYHQHPEQQSATLFVCICKSKKGRSLLVDFVRQQCDMGFVPLQTDLAPAPENLHRVV